MFSLEASVTLPFPAPAVFAVIASVEGTVRWQVGVRGVRRRRAASGAAPGVRTPPGGLVVEYVALGARYHFAARVTARRPPGAEDPPGGGSAHFAYHLADDALALHVWLGVVPTAGDGSTLTYRVGLTSLAAREPPTALEETRQAALRRLLVRRAPRDLARLEYDLGRRLHPGVRPLADPLASSPATWQHRGTLPRRPARPA